MDSKNEFIDSKSLPEFMVTEAEQEHISLQRLQLSRLQPSDRKFLQPLSRLPSAPSVEPVVVCKCLTSADPSQEEIIPERKKLIFSTVARTENYLRERRIPELVRFILTKILACDPKSSVADETAKLLDECMIFRAGLGVAPVLFEERHLEAVVKSFDPGQRGWLSTGQVRRAFTTLGLTPPANLEERIPTDVVKNKLRVTQEKELFDLLTAGVPGFTREDSIQEIQSLGATD